jgi:hypothetical protein
MDDVQYRLFMFAHAQPHARSALILIAVASLYLGLHAPFWFAIAALGCGYLDWMFSGFYMPRASKIAGWLGVVCAALAIATLAQGF